MNFCPFTPIWPDMLAKYIWKLPEYLITELRGLWINCLYRFEWPNYHTFTNHSGLLAPCTCGCFLSCAELWGLQVKSTLAEQSALNASFWMYSSINLSVAFWTVYYYRTVGNPFWERSGTVDIYHYKVYCNTLSLSFEIKAFELQMISYIHTQAKPKYFWHFASIGLGVKYLTFCINFLQ